MENFGSVNPLFYVTLLCWLWLLQLPSSAPVYSEASLVNAASQTTDRFAPNSVLTLYGANLAYSTAVARPPSPPRAGWLYPELLGGVRILVGVPFLELLFVSPTQINFRLPAGMRPANYTIQLNRESVLGPAIQIRVRDLAPELFTAPGNWLLATRPDGSLVTADTPARPGETIVFYGTGFGATVAPSTGIQTAVNWLQHFPEFAVLVNGEPSPGLYYAGVTPGYSALYQVNFTLPAVETANPEIRVSARGDRSREGTRLWFKPE